ncbi:winged helix-turn-helix transcriptional regulator [Adlercreutzia aquisgranensis]|uniref:winged helix-turn-helix transcriptional regulator n=1 Tax=Adlercreutzia aquisgranensis TaxID=2941323 RepID=UPI00203AEE7B|nr:helix-turn-helix domain-containing protein [Adlercreutzia aquisgranensis]
MDSTNTTLSLPRCPVEVTLSLISSRWSVLILRELLHGTRRFGQIRKALGSVSTKVLTANLRAMEDNGLLHRETFAEVPPRVEYSLTALGRSLRPVLMAMVEWGTMYKIEKEHGAPVRCETGEVLLVREQGDSFVALSESGEVVAQTDEEGGWNVERDYASLVGTGDLAAAQSALMAFEAAA